MYDISSNIPIEYIRHRDVMYPQDVGLDFIVASNYHVDPMYFSPTLLFSGFCFKRNLHGKGIRHTEDGQINRRPAYQSRINI